MSTQDVISKIEMGVEEAVPLLSTILSFFPQTAAIVPFLRLLPTIVEGVQTVQAQTGVSQTTAIAQVQAHNTAGMPNAPALAETATR